MESESPTSSRIRKGTMSLPGYLGVMAIMAALLFAFTAVTLIARYTGPKTQGALVGRCPFCGRSLEPGATACDGCGLPLPPPFELPRRWTVFHTFAVILLCLWLGFISWTIYNEWRSYPMRATPQPFSSQPYQHP